LKAPETAPLIPTKLYCLLDIMANIPTLLDLNYVRVAVFIISVTQFIQVASAKAGWR
jgi:hypothetical protein